MHKHVRLIIISSNATMTTIPGMIRRFLDTLPEMAKYRGGVETNIALMGGIPDMFTISAIKMTLLMALFSEEDVYMVIDKNIQSDITQVAEAMSSKFTKHPPILISEDDVYIYRLLEPNIAFYDSPFNNKQIPVSANAYYDNPRPSSNNKLH